MLLSNCIKIKVIGKNIERFIKRLHSEKVEMLEITYINYKEVNIKIYAKDYELVQKLKTIYEIEIIEIYGFLKLKQKIKENIVVILSIIIGCIIVYFLSNTIFTIEVIHSDYNLRKLIYEELENNGIEKYKFKKSYDEIQKIKENIINKYKDKIEWIEIEEVGTKYIVRLEERIINNEKEEISPRNIIAKKDAIILSINGTSGEVIKNKNDYVKKGDILISGEIKLYDEIKKYVRADGVIYGEVWYKASVEYPLNYYEEIKTGKKKKVLTITFLNKQYRLFDFNPYKDEETKKNIIVKNDFVPFNLSFDEVEELNIIDQKFGAEEAKKKAIEEVTSKIESKLKDKEHVIDVKCLKSETKDSKIILELFITVCENITDEEEIIIENIEGENVQYNN